MNRNYDRERNIVVTIGGGLIIIAAISLVLNIVTGKGLF